MSNLTAYRGDSGKNQIKMICNKLGPICRADGIRHPQVEFIENVPRVTPAATMAPINQEALNSEPI